MTPAERRKSLETNRPVIFAMILPWPLVSYGLSEVLFPPQIHSELTALLFNRDWTTSLACAAVWLGTSAVSAWFAPKVYCDYVESIERERAEQSRVGSIDSG